MEERLTDVALALTYEKDVQGFDSDVVAMSWTPEAAATLEQLLKAALASESNRRNEPATLKLPSVSLRNRLQLQQPGWVNMKPDVGLGWLRNSDPFGYVASDRWDIETSYDAAAGWITGPVVHYATKFGAGTAAVDHLRELTRAKSLFAAERHRVKLFPWSDSAQHISPYEVGAGEIAALLTDAEIFPGLGSMVRTVGDARFAELMTLPQVAAGGFYSLVCQISLQTVPGAKDALIYVNVSRRRWATQLEKAPFDVRSIGGFAIAPHLHPGLAFRFELVYRKDEGWKTEAGFDDLAHHLALESGYVDERVLPYPNSEKSLVLVMQKAGTSSGEGDLDVGVPADDQHAAFNEVCRTLGRHGFAPFKGFSRVKARASRVPRLNALQAPTVLGKLIGQQPLDEGEVDPEAAAIGDQVLKLTKRPLEDWFGTGKRQPKISAPFPDLASLMGAMVKLAGPPAEDRRNLYVVTEGGPDTPWMRTVIGLMFADALNVKFIPLPSDAHGPKESTGISDRKQRAEFRTQAWKRFARSTEFGPRPLFLVQAPMFYEVNGKWRPDDRMNKGLARRTLATELGATVQYLLPPAAKALDKYLLRLQAALLDLVYGHGGSLMGVHDAAARCFPQDADRPRLVAGIGAVKVEVRGARPRMVYAASRVNVVDGSVWLRLAHLEQEPVISAWMRFDEALSYVAKRDRLEVGTGPAGQNLCQRFVKEVLDSLAGEDSGACVFLDTAHLRRAIPSLADAKCGIGTFSTGVNTLAPKAWAGLRLIRVRDQVPLMVAMRSEAGPDGTDLRWATSVRRLFSVDGASAPTFWSVAGPTTQHKRGISCYRPRQLPSKNGAQEFAPDSGHHANPRGVELVIMQRGRDDDVDALAGFAQMLRAGIPQARGDVWVKHPSPLFILDKLGDYMAS